MDNQNYYRSPIDKLVVESGISATLIAQYMGVKYHRMVALRRLKSVWEEDIELCKQAIASIKQSGIKYRKRSSAITGKSQPVKSETKLIKQEPETKPVAWKMESSQIIQSKKMELSQQARSLSYLLGKALSLLKITTDSLQTYVQTMPEEFLEQHKKLIEQCDKLLNV